MDSAVVARLPVPALEAVLVAVLILAFLRQNARLLIPAVQTGPVAHSVRAEEVAVFIILAGSAVLLPMMIK